jgi:hypothetical protein
MQTSCGYTAPYYRIPFKIGYTVALGRSPVIEHTDEGIYIPSDYVTRHIGVIRCTKSINDELLHVLSTESQKTIFYKNDKPIPSNYGDILSLGVLPITLQYTLEVVAGCIEQTLEQEYYKTTFS